MTDQLEGQMSIFDLGIWSGKTSPDIKVDCKIDVDRRTAETCLKLVEAYLNSNRKISIYIGERKDGAKDLSFVDRTGWVSK